MPRHVTAYIVNAFSNGSTGGSPTGVVLDASGLSDTDMQVAANQLSASHTAFVFEPPQSDRPIRIRFFTSGGEILNCGHGTIAAHFARTIQRGNTLSHTVVQEVGDGMQNVEVIAQENAVEIYLKQSEIRFSSVDPSLANELLSALTISESDLNKELPFILASPGSNRFLLGLRTREHVLKLSPDFGKLKLLSEKAKSMGCFAFSLDSIGPELEATARMFAPSIGVNEDIINGNSSGCLCAYIMHARSAHSMIMRVRQGYSFSSEGVVKVRGARIGDRIETIIGGTARIEKEILIELP